MKKDNRSRFQIRLSALKRLAMWHLLSERLDLVLLTEYPKSGGTWLSNLVSSYLEIPFPHHRSPNLERSLMHGHYLYSDNFKNLICLNRDGRDIMISYYHHMFAGVDILDANYYQKDLDFLDFKDLKDIQANLPKYIEYMFANYNKNQRRFSWSEFVQSFYGKEHVIHIRYEDLLISPQNALAKVINKLSDKPVNNEKLNDIIEQFSFSNQTKRKPGQENKKSFLRKGIAGDWKNHFSKEACQIFDHYAGKELIHLGYEKDHNWY